MLFVVISGVKQGDSLNHCWLIIAMIYQTDDLKLFLFTNTCKQWMGIFFMRVTRRV